MFRYTRRAITLVWATNKKLAIALGAFTLVAGLLPALAAWLGKLIVDGVIAYLEAGPDRSKDYLLWLVGFEGLTIAGIAGCQAGISLCQALLRAQLGHRVNAMILEKAISLDLVQFEDSEFYDKLTRARRQASNRPLSLVNRAFGLIQNAISLVSYGFLLFQFHPLAVLILLLGGLPPFLAEVKFSGEAFRLFYWRSPETRKQMYLETVLAREDYIKEVRIYGLGKLLLDQYKAIFHKLYGEDRSLAIRRATWGFALGLIGTLALYGSYAWVVIAATAAAITIGQMTMYMMLFKQGQSAISASLSSINGMYEDNLYLANLDEFLAQETIAPFGTKIQGADQHAPLEFHNVSFTYPGSQQPAVNDVSFSVARGKTIAIVGANGSGKTTLVKLLTRLYEPTQGTISFQGTDLSDWNRTELQKRVAVIFQDFARYQFLLGENIGAGDPQHFSDEARWAQAARQGMVTDFLDELDEGLRTQLGRWFKDGRELSGGQWQKVALARAFMREEADIIVLDEPTAAMDAEAEARIYDYIKEQGKDKITILISHRFSTVRMADDILVMEQGQIVERGDHSSLLEMDGRYAKLYELQARAFQ